MVPVDSSAARIPFPGVPMYAALAISSSAFHFINSSWNNNITISDEEQDYRNKTKNSEHY